MRCALPILRYRKTNFVTSTTGVGPSKLDEVGPANLDKLMHRTADRVSTDVVNIWIGSELDTVQPSPGIHTACQCPRSSAWLIEVVCTGATDEAMAFSY